jgi:glucose-6-phosphate isomerase
MGIISLKTNFAKDFLNEEELQAYQQQLFKIQKDIQDRKTPGAEFLGWVDLPANIEEKVIQKVERLAKKMQELSDFHVVIGIGGSYLGARAVIESLDSNFPCQTEKRTQVIYAGQNLSEDYLAELIEFLKDKSFTLSVISKSGTTTEPAVAFRLLKQELENKYGKEEAAERIIAITDKEKGALKQLATQEDYETFVVPDDVGGRFSVLTPVGLLPIAIAGFDIQQLLAGAKRIHNISAESSSLLINPAALYAAARNVLYNKGYQTEVLVSYNPRLTYFSEWWKQLYGESEGKDGKGIFPASVSFTTDLHSMGQYLQDGRRVLFETVISIDKPNKKVLIPADDANLDGLNYLADKRVEFVNQMAEKGTILAHNDGGVPVLQLQVPELNAFYIGQLIYFFELACAYSGLILGVNPFDQPGVEAYKKNMFSLLGKPGFEDEELRKRAGLN